MTQPADAPGCPDVPPVPAGSIDPLVAADLAGWLGRIADTVLRSLGVLLPIHLAAAAVGAVLTLLFGALAPTPEALLAGREIGTTLLVVGVLAAVSGLTACVSVYVVIVQAAGGRPDPGSALAFAGRRVLPFLGWAGLAGLLVGFGAVLVVPGIYFVLVFGASLHGVVIVERSGIARCFTLVHRRFAATVARMTLLILAGITYLALVGVLTTGLGPQSVAAVVVDSVLGALFGVAQIAVFVVTWAELRGFERPGTTTATLAAELYR
jgi:hypothetical protein